MINLYKPPIHKISSLIERTGITQWLNDEQRFDHNFSLELFTGPVYTIIKFVGGDKMKFKNKPESTLKWFLILLIPIVNFYGFWKLAKVLANLENERGD